MSDCCGPTCCSDDPTPLGNSDGGATATVHDKVRDGYAQVAESGTLTSISLPTGGGCCGTDPGQGGWSQDELAEKLGYGSDDLAALPQGANMGLSCGNPTAIAALEPGQVVVDLGSGGGFDCFLAGPKVGATGRVIGVDMTPPMLTKARGNLGHYRTTSGLDNVEFRLGEIEHLPLADASVDVVISNCVINLSPDKPQVWREIARVLKPGGRVAASDMALLRPLPESVAGMVEALVGCIAGAVLVDDYRAMVEAAGLSEIVLTPKADYVAALASLDDPLYRQIAEALPVGETVADYVTSLDVTASHP
ncbi:MAG: arsenite methyltransferase [Planctomycetota bacterium]